MLKQPTIEDGIISEAIRIDRYEQRDGKEEALRVANRLLDTYHRCLADKDHFARLKEYRGSYIGSICFLEQYVGDVAYELKSTLPSKEQIQSIITDMVKTLQNVVAPTE